MNTTIVHYKNDSTKIISNVLLVTLSGDFVVVHKLEDCERIPLSDVRFVEVK